MRERSGGREPADQRRRCAGRRHVATQRVQRQRTFVGGRRLAVGCRRSAGHSLSAPPGRDLALEVFSPILNMGPDERSSQHSAARDVCRGHSRVGARAAPQRPRPSLPRCGRITAVVAVVAFVRSPNTSKPCPREPSRGQRRTSRRAPSRIVPLARGRGRSGRSRMARRMDVAPPRRRSPVASRPLDRHALHAHPGRPLGPRGSSRRHSPSRRARGARRRRHRASRRFLLARRARDAPRTPPDPARTPVTIGQCASRRQRFQRW